MESPLIEVRNLTKKFPIKGGILNRTMAYVNAVNGVSFQIRRGETLGLVGESGCGKSTLGRSLLRLIEPTCGEVLFRKQDITKFNKKRMREMRKKMQIIFQDPYASLNPRMNVGNTLAGPMEVHKLFTTKREREKRMMELLDQVQLPRDSLNKYPHEFSGGQRQRICIARALAVEPEFIVCDEPVSALDVSIQGQILNLLMDLQEELKLSYLFIAHDLRVVEHISNQVAVMYLGHIIEVADSFDLQERAQHPYTKTLYSAIPKTDPKQNVQRTFLEGDMPSAISPPSGCHFHPRCKFVIDQCRKEYPSETRLNQIHKFKCFNPIK